MMIKLKIYDDELLSSYLFRLSRMSYTNVSTINNYFFNAKRLYLKDIDLYSFTKKDLKKIEYLDLNTIYNHQLLQYQGFLEDKIHINGRHKWITPLQRLKSKSTFYGTRFCSLCLAEEPYLKIKWRLLFQNICSIHKCYLLNSCPNCNESIKFPASEYNQEIYQCYKCKFDLRNSSIKKVKSFSREVKVQNILFSIMTVGYYKLNNRYYYSTGLFYLLRILIKNVMKSKKKKVSFIEQLSPRELSYFLTFSLLLLKKFPYRLNTFYKKNKLTNINRILDKYKYRTSNIPSWYLSNIQYNTINTRWYF